MRVVNLEEMREIESYTFNECGVSESTIIENVGVRGAEYIEEHFLQDDFFGELVTLIGPGNNGADGLAIARHLRNDGHTVRAFLLFPEENCSEELKIQLKMARAYGVKISDVKDVEQIKGYFTQTQDRYFVIDAILGTGIRLPISQYLFELCGIINTFASRVVSIDIPSGVNGENGSIISAAIKADCTITIGMPKLGLYIAEGAKYVGEIAILNAGFPSICETEGDKFLLGPDRILEGHGPRSPFAYKNNFGHILVIGGSKGMTGAVVMASSAALKVGTGLITAVTWEDDYNELIARSIPEVITGVIPSTLDNTTDILRELNEKYDSVVMGPGLGKSEAARDVVLQVLNSFSGPVLLDADAINALNFKEDIQVLENRKSPTILTPHMGEFARLTNVSVVDVLGDPMDHLKSFVDKTNCTLVLKGPCSFVALPNGEVYLNYFPNDGMATAGSGDVLAGIIGGLLAQSYRAHKESFTKGRWDDSLPMCLGVYLHSLAGNIASKKESGRAMSATNIINNLSSAFLEIDGPIRKFYV